jgi:hypothetical protein
MPSVSSSAADEARAPSASNETVAGQTRWLSRLWPGGLSDLAIAIPLAAMLIMLVFWTGDRGGFPATVWYPGALIALWLLVICVFDSRYSLRLREWRTAALAFFALFTLWSFLSIIWAGVRGDAWDGANRTLFYFTVYAFFSRWRMNARIATLFVSLYSVAVAAIGLITIEHAVHAHRAASILFGWRLASPIDYPNGEAALFLIPLWPVLYLISRRELPPLVRGLLAASGSLLLQMAVLAQSRGSMYAFPIVFLLFVVFVSGRGRALVTALIVFAVSALNLSRLLDVYQAGERSNAELARALAQARNGMILPFALLLVVGTLIAVLDRRVALSERFAHRLDFGVVAGFGLALALTVCITISAVGHPIRHVETAWHNFSTGSQGGSGSSHFTSFYGTNRYDFWRVSVDEFRAHPIGGVGADNFAVEYLHLRRSDEEPANPHSIEFKVLLQTGAIGALLFLSFIASALMAARRKAVDPFRKGLAGSLVVAFAYWFVHGSVDWFWELPALATAAFALLGLSAALAAEEGDAKKETGLSPRAVLLIVPLALIVTFSYAGPWLSARYTNTASRIWRADPALAFKELDRARALDPLSAQPDLIAGTIAERRHDYAGMKTAFGRALTRDHSSWYAHFELGIAEYMTGNRSAALEQLARAIELNPREPLNRLVMRRVRARKTIDLVAINRIFLRRTLAFAVGAP